MANKTSGTKLLPVLGGLLLVILGLAAASIYLTRPDTTGSQALQTTLQRESLAAAAALRAQQAMGGDATAFGELESMLPQMRNVGAPTQTAALRSSWNDLVTNTDALLAGRESVGIVQRAATSVTSDLPALLTEMGELAAMPGQARLIDEMQRFEINAQRLEQDIVALAAAAGEPARLAGRLAGTDEYLSQFVRALSQGDATLGISAVQGAAPQAKAADIKGIYDRLSAAVRESIVTAEKFGGLLGNADAIAAASDVIVDDTTTSGADTASVALPWFVPLALLAGAALLFLIIALLSRRAAGAQKAAAFEVEQSTRNQDAILRLLDELGSLADGDLTVQATVSEDITGAIADSINYAIEALRDLVTTIDEAASQVDEAARQTQASASHLAQASENQSSQVTAATKSISDMAESIEEVSHNAERSSEVARHSVEVAHKGGEAVRRTIDGMNTIRETIQETSKRIKRLGESSQEIGNIVELINDIAEQTNILALNASIQASMAGEAGRGFAVVADEVQRLAERSANATKQIEVLVNTIQSDTNEAVVSMERSTTDVVSGALLAENAGSALDEIEKVSNQIASLVQNISGSARTQATAAADMTRNMGVLQEISSQTAEGSNATSTAIAKLAEMATELRRSVAGFTLPDKPPASVPGMSAPPGKARKSAAEVTG
ncbi:MAG: methyl-accepting chemotaxis protein [Gammaproteobacteria bacterium]|nr:methyl-accepting chemotaxis protein [Gammaproteobacteria bacterium]NNF61029.1 methyl-accepting chemotaxis protein [Gammaproteobacteria bacterium]NNM21883.1 methyl-accepting chemotaxis protein [Gammaproteobacteria bacterium]